MSGLPAAVVSAVRAAAVPVCRYVYVRAELVSAARRLRAALPAGARLLYAVKANSHPEVVAALAGEVDGLEVASGGELALARRLGVRRVSFGGPGKTDAELADAVAAGVRVHVESVHEMRRLAWLAGGAGAAVPVALRVNPVGLALSGSHAMAGATPFGMGVGQVPEAVAAAGVSGRLRVDGLHVHAVSNNLDAAAHADYVQRVARWAVAVARRHRMPLAYLNVGGGLGVDYVGGRLFDVAVLGAGVARARELLPAAAELVLEPGRWLAAGAGWYAAQVLDVKRVQRRWFAVLRGGTHHFRLPAAWGYSHPVTVLPVPRWPYPFARPRVRDSAVDVVGELCTPRDVLARGVRVRLLRAGDVVVFGQVGAYGWDISHHDFLRHPHPEVVMV